MKAFDDTHNLCDHRVLAWKLFFPNRPPASRTLPRFLLHINRFTFVSPQLRSTAPPSLPRLADRDRGCIAAAPDYFFVELHRPV